MTGYLVPVLRRLTQAVSIGLLVLLPLLALYSHYHEAHGIDDLPDDEWRPAAIKKIDELVAENEKLQSFIKQTQGTFWSMRLGGYSLSDPLSVAESVLSSRSFYRPLMWSLLVPVVVTVLLGRVFCGWICPMNTLLEAVDKLRKLLCFIEIRERDLKFSLLNKYAMAAIGLGIVLATSVPFFALVYPPAMISREIHLWIFGAGVGIGVYLILAVCLFELFVSKRWWCRYVCPGGAIYSLLGRFRTVRIQRDLKKCVDCGDCISACQFGLKPMLVKTTGMECTNCSSCITSCDSDALKFQLVLPLVRLQQHDEPPQTPKKPFAENQPHLSDETKPEVQERPSSKITVGVFLLTLLICQSADAHHILGLPHYSYKENYPQAPTLEYPARVGPFNLLMTSYPGRPVPGEAAIIAFYIKNRRTDEIYDQPVSVRVLQNGLLWSQSEVHPPKSNQPFDNQYKYSIEFPEEGEFVVELTMESEGQTEIVPFEMVIGQPKTNRLIGVTIAVSLILLVVVRATVIKSKRRRTVKQTELKSQNFTTSQ